jgi:hypothetical protein
MASMTATEVRDRLDNRFRLLIGSRRGLERHQTLRHAVAWSYDLLDEAEKILLEQCSVFAGGFDLQSACAVSGSNDEFATLDLLDALVRKSLLIADRSADATRYSMLETIREFAEHQSALRGEADEIRAAHARHFAHREREVLVLWDSPRQRQAYLWFHTELANLRAAFRWAADHSDIAVAATIATYTSLLGMLLENYEPATWAEELIESARAVEHPRLAALYVMASQCYNTGRVDDAIRICEDGRTVLESRSDEVPFGIEGIIGTVYVTVGQPERWIDLCRALLARGRDTHAFTRACLVYALIIAGCIDEAMTASEGLIDDAEATGNPYALANALLAVGFAFRDADPLRALHTLRRSRAISQDTGSRFNESHLNVVLSGLEADHGDPLGALDCLAVAIGNYHDSGNSTMIRSPLAVLATYFDRLGHYESAATIAGFGVNLLTPLFTEIGAAIEHLRSVLGDITYEELARNGATMSAAAMAAYALDQIDEVRVELARSQ